MLETVQIFLVAIAAVCQTCFVGLYSLRPWWRHYVGKALFYKSLSLALLLDTQIMSVWVQFRYQELLDTVVIAVVTGAVVIQLGALARQMRSSLR